MRLIDADAVEKVLTDLYIKRPLDSDRWVIVDVEKGIRELPAVDAVPVIRCCECKYFKEFEKGFSSDWDGSCQYWNTHSTVYSNFCGCAVRIDKK